MSYALPLYGDTLLCVSGYEPFCAHQTYCPALGMRGTMLLYEALSFSRESNMDRPPLEGSMRMPVMLKTHLWSLRSFQTLYQPQLQLALWLLIRPM